MSVGNIPPDAWVLIKIAYVAQVCVEDETISFRLPGSIAPWKRASNLADETQVICAVDDHCVSMSFVSVYRRLAV